MPRVQKGGLLLLFVGLVVWLRWVAAAPSVGTPAPDIAAFGLKAARASSEPPMALRPPRGSFGSRREGSPAAERASVTGAARLPSSGRVPERIPSERPPSRSAPGREGDAELAILEEEASRAALRQGLVPASKEAYEEGGQRDAGDGQRSAPDPDAERRTLSDELLIDHLVSDTYRTTLFPPEQDAVAESRAAARSLLASIPIEERRELLRAALGAETPATRPEFQALPGSGDE